MSNKPRPIEELYSYEKTIEKVVVTYGDNSQKEFTPSEWFLFEEGVRRIAKKVNVIKNE